MPTLADFYAASNENAAIAKGKEVLPSASASAPTETVAKTEVLEKFIEAYYELSAYKSVQSDPCSTLVVILAYITGRASLSWWTAIR